MLTRRELLKGLVAGAATAVIPGVAFARIAGDKRLVVMILRGGMDGLAAVVPYAERDYRELRGSLAFAPPGKAGGVMDLDGRFGLHPSLAGLHDMWVKKELLAFHAMALPHHSRSHFDAQDLLENGSATPHGATDGWLNRTLHLLGPSTKPLGLSIGHSMPLLMQGQQKVDTWSPIELPDLDGDFLDRLERIYSEDKILRNMLAQGLASDALAEQSLSGTRTSRKGAGAKRMAEVVAAFLRDPDGPRIAALDIGGWDTHATQGLGSGRLAVMMQDLADSLQTLKTGLGPVWRDTAVIVLTEFGRTVRPNGSGGTDHGTAGAGFLLGGAVAGGTVVTNWPGLAPHQLYEGRDLAPTLDVRAAIAALLNQHLEIPTGEISRYVFPGVKQERLCANLIRN